LTLRIATRRSALARAQAAQVAELLGGGELIEVSSDGEPGDKARFVRAVEQALLDGEAEIGVHSAKDLPTEMNDGLEIAATPPREDPTDVWIGAGASLGEVPRGTRVGTTSLRRRAQLLAARPDLQVAELHGNVDTRLLRLREGEFEAIVLAAAGLRRLGREGEVSFPIAVETMTPAGGQGTLVLQVRSGDQAARQAAASIGDPASLLELTVERATLARLNASCMTPIGVRAQLEGERLSVEAFLGLPDGSEWIRDRIEGVPGRPRPLGELLAERLISAGARDLLERAGAMP
jgi:hydroxymethylbilane synthase